MKKIASLLLVTVLLLAPALSISAATISDVQYGPTQLNGVFITRQGNTEITYIPADGMTIYDTFDYYNNTRTIRTVSDSGTETLLVENTVTGYVQEYVNDRQTKTYNIIDERSRLTKTFTLPKSIEAQIDAAVDQLMSDDSLSTKINIDGGYSVVKAADGTVDIIEPSSISLLAAGTPVNPAGSVTSTYPEYRNKSILTTTVVSSALSRSLSILVRDSMYSYTQTHTRCHALGINTAISVVMSVCKLAASAAQSLFSGYWKVVSGITQLSRACDFYYENKYKYYALRQGCVFDYTGNNRYVSIDSQTGTGEISLSSSWNSSSGYYYNWHWSITANAAPFLVSTSTVVSTTQRIWEDNILAHGYWPWGDI